MMAITENQVILVQTFKYPKQATNSVFIMPQVYITMTEAMSINTSGDVVVGKKIFIDRSGYINTNNKFVLWDGGTGSTTAFNGFGIKQDTMMYNVNATTDNHIFYYGATNELLRIGNAGISASRTITMTDSTSQLYFSDGTTTTCGIRWYDDAHSKRNTNEMYFREYGTWYFQTTGSNTRATLTSSGIVNTSDRRHKTDIRDAEFCGLDVINALKPKCFKLRESKRENCGFLARDIEELV